MNAKRRKPLLIRAVEEKSDGTTTEKTVNAADVHPAPKPAHEALPDELRQRAEALYWRIGQKARPELTIGKWIDQFRYDREPEDEVLIWEHVAATFERLDGASLGAEMQRQTLQAILLVSLCAVDIESQTGLSEAEVERLRCAYDQH